MISLPAINTDDNCWKDEAVSCSYIHKVQHLIELCLTFGLDKDECAEALSKHAGIQSIITLTVWKELEKSNPDFFRQYSSNASNNSCNHKENVHHVLQSRIAREFKEN